MMLISSVVKLFENHSVTVTGMKGTGKDTLIGNVIARRGKKYASNMDYGGQRIAFKYSDIDLHADFKNMISGNVPRYVYPYGEGCDIYLSDCGVYFPSQYCSELNKLYPSLPLFMALSRHFGDVRVHCNTQNLNRIWDKIREMSSIYITTNKCYHFGWLVIQQITIYDKASSCIDRIKPVRLPVRPFLSSDAIHQEDLYIDNHYNQYGRVDRRWLIYLNKSSHDTYYFKKFFENGGIKNEK